MTDPRKEELSKAVSDIGQSIFDAGALGAELDHLLKQFSHCTLDFGLAIERIATDIEDPGQKDLIQIRDKLTAAVKARKTVNRDFRNFIAQIETATDQLKAMS